MTWPGKSLVGLCSLSLGTAGLCADGDRAASELPFELLGSPARISENRGFLPAQDAQGRNWLVGLVRDMVDDEGSRTSLLMIAPETGHAEQFFYTAENTITWDSFCLFLSSKNKLYTTIGGVFLEFDIDQKKFTYIQPKPIDGNDHCFSMAEDPAGRIFFASYPDARLEVFDPATRTVSFVTRLDPHEKYPTTLAVDDDGWIYAGVGPAQGLLIAYHPETKVRKQLVPEKEILKGSYPVVLKDRDGKIYASTAPQMPYRRPFHLLRGGEFQDATQPALSKETAPYPPNSLYAFSKALPLKFPDGSSVRSLDLITKTFQWTSPGGDTSTKVFDYKSDGPAISALVTGEDGLLYGSTEHPMVFWSLDPRTGSSRIEGPIPKIGGGNITKFIRWNHELIGNSYSEGLVFAVDPSKPFHAGGSEPNPRQLDQTTPWVARPRALIAHPDGRHILSSGFPAYGYVGGGLWVYDMTSGNRTALYEDSALCPGQTVSALAALPNGDIVFGTSIWTPGGGTTSATSAKVGLFSWKDKSVSWMVSPVAGAETITSLVTKDDRIIGITTNSILFEMDVASHKPGEQVSLTEWGEPVGRRGDTSFLTLPDGRTVLGMQKGLFLVKSGPLRVEKLSDSPVLLRDGLALAGDKIYVAAFNRLIAFPIPKNNTPNPTQTENPLSTIVPANNPTPTSSSL